MLAARIAGRVLSRAGYFALRGLRVGCLCGVASGTFAGAAIGISWAFIPSTSLFKFLGVSSTPFEKFWLAVLLAIGGAFNGLFCGACLGAVTETVVFGIAGALSGKCDDAKSLVNHVSQNVLRPSFWGTCTGTTCGIASASMLTKVLQPLEGMSWVFWGCIFGAVGGFMAGSFYGAIGSTLSYQKEHVKHEIEYSNGSELR